MGTTHNCRNEDWCARCAREEFYNQMTPSELYSDGQIIVAND